MRPAPPRPPRSCPKIALWLLVLCVLSPAAVAEAGDRLAEHLPGYEIARCAFADGKLVLERADDFLVLRQGDRIPGLPLVTVHEISPRRAVLFEAARGAAGEASVRPERIFKIDVEPDGATRVTVLTGELIFEQEALAPIDGQALFAVTPDDVGGEKP
ncbi:MAG: hypothetical protein AAGF23_11315 [Acidobacteriota bacterium]